jgi:hypothetical protein
MRLVENMVARLWEAEKEIPEERRKADSIHDRGTDIGRDDDPRWTAVNAQYWNAVDHEDAVAWSFVDRPPTTIEGAAAILAYADEYESGGFEWPDSRHHFTAAGAYAGRTEEDWRKSLNTAIIPALCSASSSPAAVSAADPASALPDPAIAAVERFRSANRAWGAIGDQEPELPVHHPKYEEWQARFNDFGDMPSRAHDAMVATCPTTKPGAQAMIAAHLDWQRECCCEEESRTLLKTLAAAIPHLV